MIEGLKLDVTSSELKQHLLERAEHHQAREAFYLARASDLDGPSGQDEDTEHWDFSNSGRGDPRQSMRDAARQHRDRAAYFSFLRDHLIDETYRLTEADFRTLEFVDRWGR